MFTSKGVSRDTLQYLALTAFNIVISQYKNLSQVEVKDKIIEIVVELAGRERLSKRNFLVLSKIAEQYALMIFLNKPI